MGGGSPVSWNPADSSPCAYPAGGEGGGAEEPFDAHSETPTNKYAPVHRGSDEAMVAMMRRNRIPLSPENLMAYGVNPILAQARAKVTPEVAPSDQSAGSGFDHQRQFQDLGV